MFWPSRVALMEIVKETQGASNPHPQSTPTGPHTDTYTLLFLVLVADVPQCHCCSSPLLSGETQHRRDRSCSASVHITGFPAQIHWRPSYYCHKRCHLCSPPPDRKASLIRPYFHRHPFSKLIFLPMFIDETPRQGGLVSLVVGVLALPDEGGPQ